VALYYLSTAADAVRFDTPTYQLYVGGGVPGAPLGYVGPFVSLSGIVQVYMTGSSAIQSRDIQATDNPATFPLGTTPLALLSLDAVGRIQRITDYTPKGAS
jgi:hypothetical protein